MKTWDGKPKRFKEQPQMHFLLSRYTVALEISLLRGMEGLQGDLM